ncbi:hypothetical protein A4G29_12765 [Mycobacterium kansasii]|nr:hypothetical protein A4G29_12765 [Mycobacterium kansasii]
MRYAQWEAQWKAQWEHGGRVVRHDRAATTDGGSSVVEEDVVVRLDTAQPDQPVGVHFGRHAASTCWNATILQFAAWLAVLHRSLDEGTPVRFAYAVAGPRLTLVEPAD